VYSNADIILLDDVLSAVDAHVGKHIFDACIRGALQGKTVIFASNQTQFLSGSDRIIVVNEGCIEADGTHDEALAASATMRALVEEGVQTEAGGHGDAAAVAAGALAAGALAAGALAPSRSSGAPERAASSSRVVGLPSAVSTDAEAGAASRLASKNDADKYSLASFHTGFESLPSYYSTSSEEVVAEKDRARRGSGSDSDSDSDRDGDSSDGDEGSLVPLDKKGRIARRGAGGGDEGEDAARSASAREDYKRTAGNLTGEENSETGAVSFGVYRKYASAMGNFVFATIIVLLLAFSVSSVLVNWWLSVWSDAGSEESVGDVTPEHKTLYYLRIYAVITGTSVVFAAGYGLMWALGSVRAGSRLHDTMLASVLAAPTSFFDTTPAGRIINRFSNDLEVGTCKHFLAKKKKKKKKKTEKKHKNPSRVRTNKKKKKKIAPRTQSTCH
jgi:hypothetical protein